MLIKNIKDIAITPLRKRVLEIIEVGIESVLPSELIPPVVKYDGKMNTVTLAGNNYHLIKGRIFVIGGGKASGLMAVEIEKIIGADNIAAGIVNTVKGKYRAEGIEINEAEHPLPDRKGIKGTERMLALKDKYEIGGRDLVICLLSGGGSAMLSAPADGISLNDMRQANELLVKSGASIKEINTVRKHISLIKGGQLAGHFAPAKVVSLIISDVVGNDLSAIASGPTVPDPTTFNDAQLVLEKYRLIAALPASIKEYIEQGCDNKAKETPKQLANADNFIIGKNALALEAMAHTAKQAGFKPLIVTHELAGETETAAKEIAAEIKTGRYRDYDALIFGGETAPQVPAKAGKGGRNQHFIALIMEAMRDYPGEWLAASVSTDGQDYNTGVAGAIADNSSHGISLEKGLDARKYLGEFDTYSLFEEIGRSQIITGDTGTNVADVAVIVKK